LTKAGALILCKSQKNCVQYAVYISDKAVSCLAGNELSVGAFAGFLDEMENGALIGGFAASGKVRFAQEPKNERRCTGGREKRL
jgi:hypothetical protein